MSNKTTKLKKGKKGVKEAGGSSPLGSSCRRSTSMFSRGLLKSAVWDALVKLDPRFLWRKPVIFLVEIGAAVVSGLLIRDFLHGRSGLGFELQISVWLWFTVVFANFAEAMAEARGKAQADSLRKTKTETLAKVLTSLGTVEKVPSSKLRGGDIVFCEAGDIIPGDGEVIEGIATVDESVITGESAPVIRESGGDRSAVTGGTKVLSDQIKVRITSEPGETFLDRMIALVEGARRQKTPNEVALTILILGLTLIFLIAVFTLQPLAEYSVRATGAGETPSLVVLVSLLVCLMPTTIGGLLSAIGIAGMDRVLRHNVLAMSGKAVEAAGDVNTLLLDKTGTITMGSRQAVEFIPLEGIDEQDLADAAQLASFADETPEGRSVVVLAKRYGLRGRSVSERSAEFIPFSAYSRMSGVDVNGRRLRKGASEAVAAFVRENGGETPPGFDQVSERISRTGGTPLAVADGASALGFIHLKDVVKGGMRERLSELRSMGIRTVMVTGDNPLTAAAIAEEAGVDDFLAEVDPARKLDYIKREQAGGRLIAMAGDGTNDAPALAQADVGLAMNTGTIAAKEAGNMVDLDSNPTKLIEVVAIGKELLITRGALTTFSIANDMAKYFAIIPAMFVATYPALGTFNIMHLHDPRSAILSAVVFNALIIVALIPLALRGVGYKPRSAAWLLRRNLLVYGLGGIAAPFPGIWLISQILVRLGLA